MKTLFSFLITLFFLQITFAQGPYTEAQRRKDQAKLDSICRRSPTNCSFYGELIGANSVFKNHVPRRIERNRKICFDKKFQYYSNTYGKVMRGCFYINTKDGYVAQFMSRGEESCDGMANPQPGFDMMIISKIGESFTFRVSKEGKKTFFAQLPPEDIPYGMLTNFVLNNPNALASPYREPFTSQNLPTLPYRIEGSTESSKKYLFSAYHAQRISIKDYIGAFGTGYYKDSMGNTMIALAVESDKHFVKIEKIEDVNECFDGRDFGDEMQEAIATNEEIIREKEKDLEYQGNNDPKKNCEAAEALVQHKRQMLDKEKNLNNFLKAGGSAQSREGLRLGAMAMDVIDKVVTDRLELEKRICSQEYSLYIYNNNSGYGEKLKTIANNKIQCYNIAINQLNELKTQLEQINARNGTNYAKAISEKNLHYFKKIKDIDLNCNFDKDGKKKTTTMDAGAQKLRDQIQEIMKRR